MKPSLQDKFHQARFYAILDAGMAPEARLPTLCAEILAGGAGVIQLRAKDATTAWRVGMLSSLAPLCAQAGIPLICNDDLDATLAVPGTGLHIGQDDMPPEIARAELGPELPLGLSTHSLEQAKRAIACGDMLTYFAVGPVFPTQTKPDYPAVGLDLVRAVAALHPATPWFCIGGITRANAAQVRDAGAIAVVAVSEVMFAPDAKDVVRSFRAVMG